MGDLVLGYADAATAGPAAVGGKGGNLGRLHRYGFPVPAGGVLVADAYVQHMAAPSLRAMAAGMTRVQAEEADTPAVSAALARLLEGIETAGLPAAIPAAARRFLRDTGLADASTASPPWSTSPGC
jgi:pyruvate,water dikinase